MKRRFFAVTLALLMSLLLIVSASAAGRIDYVTDAAGILTSAEQQSLEQMAHEISDKHNFGVYIITVDSFRDFTDSYDVFDGATALYKKYDLGLGDDRRGVLLLLSMGGRDFSLITYSDYGNFVFDQETREEMTGWFLDDFAYDDWFVGFCDYLDTCDRVLMNGPDKVQSEINTLTAMIFLIPLFVALIAIFILSQRMKSVSRATQAEAYAEDGLILTNSHDLFTHATEVRRKRESSSSGSSGIRSSSSGGFGGTSGKF